MSAPCTRGHRPGRSSGVRSAGTRMCKRRRSRAWPLRNLLKSVINLGRHPIPVVPNWDPFAPTTSSLQKDILLVSDKVAVTHRGLGCGVRLLTTISRTSPSGNRLGMQTSVQQIVSPTMKRDTRNVGRRTQRGSCRLDVVDSVSHNEAVRYSEHVHKDLTRGLATGDGWGFNPACQVRLGHAQLNLYVKWRTPATKKRGIWLSFFQRMSPVFLGNQRNTGAG